MALILLAAKGELCSIGVSGDMTLLTTATEIVSEVAQG